MFHNITKKISKRGWMVLGGLLFLLGLFLVFWRPWSGGIRHAGHKHDTLQEYYTCAMHPQIIQDKPGNCPICGMRLIKKTKAPKEEHEGHEKIPKDLKEISISPVAQVLANVAMTEVVRKELTKTIRTVGIVAFDRDLYVASQEYLSALKIAKAAGTGGFGTIAKQGRESLKAAGNKLELMGMSQEEISEIEKTGKTDRSLYFPKKEGPVWIHADIFEQEREWIRENMEVAILVDAYPGETFHGKIVSIAPLVRFPTRSFKVRIRISHPAKQLDPEMFAEAKLKINVGTHLAVPTSSVINTGDRRVVWVHIEKNRFAPRKISLGHRIDDSFIVLEGLQEGEHVVSQGGFLLDSEAELKSFGMAEGGGSSHQH